MENFEQRWKAVEQMLTERFEKLPDMEGVLFLIGVNELGRMPDRKKFSKEQKQDLMHIAVCKLLSTRGYFELQGHDDEGWPHYVKTSSVSVEGLKDQERLLKECAIEYFGL